MHGYAKKAAMAALAAERQGKFWEVHEKLFSSQRELNDSKVEELVRDLGLNIDQFNSDLKDPALGLLIDRDIINGRQANVKGTPTIFVNRKLLSTRSLQGFQLAIEAELKKKK